MATNLTQLIIDSLDIMRKREVAEKQTFKARAYQKVINQLKSLTYPITSYKDVEIIDGIGEKIGEKIKEIIETGTSQSVERVKEKYNIKALDALQAIYGVGPTKANDLIEAGITTIEQLRQELKTNPKILNDKQKIGLKYYEELLERIPRIEMEEHEDILKQLIPDESDFYIEIVGSYRRGAESSGDIDVLIRIPEDMSMKTAIEHFNMYIKLLEGFGYITDILAQGDKKCMAICKVYNGKRRRLDLLLTAANEYPFALMYFTGSDRFNVTFRQMTLDKGYTLNEHSLTPIRESVPPVPSIKTERAIFSFFNLDYVKPCDRTEYTKFAPMKKKPRLASQE
jgi:DNA polymerase/3'-5' exonuclease PolX